MRGVRNENAVQKLGEMPSNDGHLYVRPPREGSSKLPGLKIAHRFRENRELLALLAK